ncbi:hypothetical protein EMN47_16840 [Prolixibacteraceae bacterium JC049]|nr:hypothetical protein [Prolixibacteraceae bacterium JC049]
MTETENILLKEIGHNINQLTSLVEHLKRDNQQLNDEIVKLKNELEESKEENKRITGKYENLKLAKSLVGEEIDNIDAKLKLNKIVREIDRCIALLNQ